MNTQIVKDNIKQLYRDYAFAWQTISEDSWKKKVMSLKPGESAPKKGELFFTEDIDRFREQADGFRQRGLAEVEAVLDRVGEVKAAAPSTEACNYISMLRDRKNLTDRDIEVALLHYGDNYSAHNAIIDIADDNKIRGFIRTTPLDAIENRFGEIRDNLNQMNVFTAQRQNPTSGYVTMVEMMVDEIPDQII